MAALAAGAGASVIIANKCFLCGTTSRQRTYQHPSSAPVLAFFKNLLTEATWQHFFCNKCTMRAQRRLERDQSSLLLGVQQRSLGNEAPYRSDLLTMDSQPLDISSQVQQPLVVVAGDVRGSGKRKRTAEAVAEDDTVDNSLSSSNVPLQSVAERDNNVTKRRRIIDSTRNSAGHPATGDATDVRVVDDDVPAPASVSPSIHSDVSAIEPDDLVPPHLLVKPSKKPRQRKHKAPTSAAAMPRSPGGRLVSINEYVRSGAG